MSDQELIFAIDPGKHIGYAAVKESEIFEAGVITGMTESERFGCLEEKIIKNQPSLILIENSYKYKKKINHMIKGLDPSHRPIILIQDAKQIQFRLFGKPYGKYGKEKTLHRKARNELVHHYFGRNYEVHANDALLMIIDWNRSGRHSLMNL